jgi:hypothetical protein
MNEIQVLMRSLYRLLGNKVYLLDFNVLLKDKLKDLSPKDKETILYLARDLATKE